MKLRILLAHESAWIPGTINEMVKNSNGYFVNCRSSEAVSWSLLSAIKFCYHTNELREAILIKIHAYIRDYYPEIYSKTAMYSNINTFCKTKSYSDLKLMLIRLGV